MSDFDSVTKFCNWFLETGRPLDVLCCNAGIALGGGRVSADGNELLHQVNFLSHTLMTMLLLPALRMAKEPRVVCTTSCMQFSGRIDVENMDAVEEAYPNNKLYFQVWLTEFQRRCLASDTFKHITAHGIHPGYVDTGIWQIARDHKGPKPWAAYLLLTFLGWIGISSEQGSVAIVHAASAPECGADLAVQDVGSKEGRGGGRYWNRIWEDTPMPHVKSEECRRFVWEYARGKVGKWCVGDAL